MQTNCEAEAITSIYPPFCSLAVILHEPMLQFCTVVRGGSGGGVWGGDTGSMMGDAGGKGIEEEEAAGREGGRRDAGHSVIQRVVSPSQRCRARIYRKEEEEKKKDPGEAKEQKLLRHERRAETERDVS